MKKVLYGTVSAKKTDHQTLFFQNRRKAMLFTYYLSKPVNWIIPLILQVIVYYRLLRKMCMDPRPAFIPFVAEGKMAKNLFRH